MRNNEAYNENYPVHIPYLQNRPEPPDTIEGLGRHVCQAIMLGGGWSEQPASLKKVSSKMR